MEIPKIITRNNRQYIKVKEYKYFVLYKDMYSGANETFLYHDLGLVKEIEIDKSENRKKYIGLL